MERSNFNLLLSGSIAFMLITFAWVLWTVFSSAPNDYSGKSEEIKIAARDSLESQRIAYGRNAIAVRELSVDSLVELVVDGVNYKSVKLPTRRDINTVNNFEQVFTTTPKLTIQYHDRLAEPICFTGSGEVNCIMFYKN